MTNIEAAKLLHGIQRKLLGVVQALDILTIEEREMALDPTVVAIIKDIDDDATAIGVRIQAFIDAAKNAGTMTAAEVVAALQPEADRLKQLAADPTNPVPKHR